METINGEHWIIEFYGCDAYVLDDLDFLKSLASKVCNACNLKVLQVSGHKFNPVGVTMFALLAESHFSIHTWPEHGYAAVDIFSCGAKKLAPALKILQKGLDCARHSCQVIKRGQS